MATATQGMTPSEWQMTVPIMASVIFHAVVLVLVIVGLPHIRPDLPAIEQPITVEVVNVEEITRTREADVKPRSGDRPREAPPQPRETPPKPQMPQVTARTPPKPVPPQPPKEEVKPAPPETMVPPPPSPLKKPAPPEPPKPEEKAEKQSEITPAEQQEEFQSVLRNLMPAEQPAPDVPTEQPGRQAPMLTRFAQTMSISELDLLKQQLSRCWNLMAGARYAEDLVVDVRLYMNPDRTVRKAEILDRLRYNTDSFYRAAADSALRAVHNPACNPLELPPGKYDLWKVMTVSFDPREMLQ